LIDAKNDAWKTQVTELDSEAKAICRTTMLVDEGQVGFVEYVVSNPFILGPGQFHQAFPLGGGEDRTTRHGINS
jgi:hypothetical protein